MRSLLLLIPLLACVACRQQQPGDVTRYVRFVDDAGVERQGQQLPGFRLAQVIEGNLITGEYKLTDEIAPIERLLPPMPIEPPAIIAVGINYRGHADETGRPYPAFPTLFMKNPSTLSGPFDPIVYPEVCVDPPFNTVDFETELAFIVGRDALDVSEEDALDYIIGYTVGHDVSARTWQHDTYYSGTQFVRGKSFDTFCPVGPAMVTSGAIGDPNDLRIVGTLNGQVVQNSTTSDMIFSVEQILAFTSQDTTVKAGTLIMTGTPEGVGTARDPPLYMFPGDTIEMTVENIGTIRQTVIDKPTMLEKEQ